MISLYYITQFYIYSNIIFSYLHNLIILNNKIRGKSQISTVGHSSPYLNHWRQQMDCSICHKKHRWLLIRSQTLWWVDSHFYNGRNKANQENFSWVHRQGETRGWAAQVRLYRSVMMVAFLAYSCTSLFTPSSQPTAKPGNSNWELPEPTGSTTQLFGDSSRGLDSEPSFSSRLSPPPKLTGALRRFS